MEGGLGIVADALVCDPLPLLILSPSPAFNGVEHALCCDAATPPFCQHAQVHHVNMTLLPGLVNITKELWQTTNYQNWDDLAVISALLLCGIDVIGTLGVGDLCWTYSYHCPCLKQQRGWGLSRNEVKLSKQKFLQFFSIFFY